MLVLFVLHKLCIICVICIICFISIYVLLYMYYNACFFCRTLDWDGGYPVLVLQEQGPMGSKVPKISLHMKDLVIYMTQGPKPADRPCVLHFDDVVRFQGRSQLQWQQLQPWELRVQKQQGQLDKKPHHAGCLCKSCINPMCLFYGTQSENAETGSNHLYLKKKVQQAWHHKCPVGCLKCVRLLKDQAIREAAKEAKAAAEETTQGLAAAAAARALEATTATGVEPRRSVRLHKKPEHS